MTQNGKYASRESLRARAFERRFRDFPCNGEVYRLRSLNDAEFQQAVKPEGTDEIAIILAVVCDEEGNPAYAPEDREIWKQQDAAVVQALSIACVEHIGAVDGETAKNG